MRALIAICIAFAAFMSVNGDENAEWMKNMTNKYQAMEDKEIMDHILVNVKEIEGIMETAIKTYVKTDLFLVATVDLNIIKFVNDNIPKLFADIHKESNLTIRHSNHVSVGVTSEQFKEVAYKENATRTAHPINITHTEENLLKTYKVKYQRVLDVLKGVIENQKTKKGHSVWVHFHQGIYDFMSPHLKEIEEAVQHLPKWSRANNIEVMLKDLTLMMETLGVKDKPFSVTFTERVHEIYSKVKEFFAKIF